MSQRRPRTARAFHAPAPSLSGRRAPRVPRRRPRRFGSLDEGTRRRGRRNASLALAAVELAILVALVLVPVLQVRHVDVSGNRRMTAAQVVAAAGLQHPGSVVMVDPRAVERKLGGTVWVRSASVSARLPDTVSISVDEWQPVALYQVGQGRAWYLSDEAVALGPAEGGDRAGLLAIQGPGGAEPRAGRSALDAPLLTALVNIQRALPGLMGQDVQSFTLDSCGNLTLNARKGWRAQFGRVITPEERASLKDKIAALKALGASGQVDFDTVQYVNVMNPDIAAVPAPRPTPRPGRATPTPTPAPPPSSPCK